MRSAITAKTRTTFRYIRYLPLLRLILLNSRFTPPLPNTHSQYRYDDPFQHHIFPFAPKIGAMQNLRLSIHAPEHIWLRQLFIQRRLQLGLSQRALAERLNVIHSFIGKVETGDRRLDILEFILYCQALELSAETVLQQIQQRFAT